MMGNINVNSAPSAGAPGVRPKAEAQEAQEASSFEKKLENESAALVDASLLQMLNPQAKPLQQPLTGQGQKPAEGGAKALPKAPEAEAKALPKAQPVVTEMDPAVAQKLAKLTAAPVELMQGAQNQKADKTQAVLNAAVSSGANADSKAAGLMQGLQSPATRGAMEAQVLSQGDVILAKPQGQSQKTVRPQLEGERISGADYLSTLQGVGKAAPGEIPQAKSQVLAEPRSEEQPSAKAALTQSGLASEWSGGLKDLQPLATRDPYPRLLTENDSGPTQAALAQAGTGAAAMTGVSAKGRQQPPIMDLQGHVVKGAMARERLSSESLLGLSQGVRSLTPHGGGEIRMRLHPENLGEVFVRVATLGNQVSLRIQASDPGARKILEESLQFLKDGLASQNLSLGRVDLGVVSSQTGQLTQSGQPGTSGHQSFGDPLHSGHQSYQGWQDSGGREASQYESQQQARVAAVQGSSGLSSMPGAGWASGESASARAAGRLNVLA